MTRFTVLPTNTEGEKKTLKNVEPIAGKLA
jgi:hypothetical protein